ncbi:MAG: anthranilate phosphoribosyltransferase family protein [Pseudanabaenaceae cyanobacterium bins.39]|nr:anthranilate phosphoribosyltransferase family protein [Pseudanabaenaceae cyanobacterium bins.39]
MSKEFREFLRKVGSGTNTSKSLTRSEAALATEMMLQGVATPAQIGAFMIAHRIKRPTSDELAGMLDAYNHLGSKIPAIASGKKVLVLSSPYDGRSKTAPLSPATALVLAAADVPVLLHGGDRMPTKEGLPLIDIWEALGINWRNLTIAQLQTSLVKQNLSFVYLPEHFPLAQSLVPYRDQIGKRPPFATLELMWSPYEGEQMLVSGFVHPPTETHMREAFAMHGITEFATVKGWEGSIDLARSRTNIIGINRGEHFERVILSAAKHGFGSQDPTIASAENIAQQIKSALTGEPSEYLNSLLWNCGFYFWLYGLDPDIPTAITHAQTLINSGLVSQKLQTVQALT